MNQHLGTLSVLANALNVARRVGISLMADQELQHVQVLLLTSHHYCVGPSILTITVICQGSVFQQQSSDFVLLLLHSVQKD